MEGVFVFGCISMPMVFRDVLSLAMGHANGEKR